MAVVRVFKVKPQPKSWNQFRPDHPRFVGMWRGWCNECGKCVAQYWAYGASLGMSIDHIRTEHKKENLMATPNTNRFLVLATDPEEVDWTILHQTEDQDSALDFWNDNKGDPSLRILIDTSRFITFEPEEDESDAT